MAFADDFSQCLANSGITVSAIAIPSQDTLQSGLDNLSAWITSLDSQTLSALDEVTADFPTKAGLADPTVNIAPELATFLQAVDALSATLSISSLSQICDTCLQQIAMSQDQSESS